MTDGAAREWVFAFEGRYADYVLQRSEVRPDQLIAELMEHETEIERDIQSELSSALRADVDVHIEFREGSLEWTGHVRTILGVLADIGGTIALLQLMGMTISRALRRHVPRRLPHPYTRVYVIYAPQPRAAEPRLVCDCQGARLRDALILTCLAVNVAAVVALCVLTALVLGVRCGG